MGEDAEPSSCPEPLAEMDPCSSLPRKEKAGLSGLVQVPWPRPGGRRPLPPTPPMAPPRRPLPRPRPAARLSRATGGPDRQVYQREELRRCLSNEHLFI